jgi:hypothetical protein
LPGHGVLGSRGTRHDLSWLGVGVASPILR